MTLTNGPIPTWSIQLILLLCSGTGSQGLLVGQPDEPPKPPFPMGGPQELPSESGPIYTMEDTTLEDLERELDGLSHYPTLLICILVRNKAHTLPYFLGLLEDLDYDKGRINLFIRSDNNVDESEEMIVKWVENVRGLYRSIDFETIPENEDETLRPGEEFDWPDSRMERLIALKERALYKARAGRLDYILFIDCDQFLTNQRTLQRLIEQKKPIIAPLLVSRFSNYSNFWAGVTEDGYYRRTESYWPILTRATTGCFPVPMVHSTVLIDLKQGPSKMFTFDPNNMRYYKGPTDDLLAFAASVHLAEQEMYILNTENFGFLTDPAAPNALLAHDVETMRYIALEMLHSGPPGLLHSPFVFPPNPPPSKLGFDEIYLINLNRRTDRRQRMEACFDILGINGTHWPAVDGRTLPEDYVTRNGISMLPEYKDPYHKRTMTAGEIGCFMSHYEVWKDVVERKLAKVLVFEDDLRFIKYFRYMLHKIFQDIEATNLEWDLIYLGRKRLDPEKDGPGVEGNPNLYHVSYSYWTLAYALSYQGAQKLLNAEPLTKMVPVDEYLPIMFDQHPEDTWKSYFPNRDLLAFTTEPLLLFPTHYTGDEGYISDTEDTLVVDAFIGPSPHPEGVQWDENSEEEIIGAGSKVEL